MKSVYKEAINPKGKPFGVFDLSHPMNDEGCEKLGILFYILGELSIPPDLREPSIGA